MPIVVRLPRLTPLKFGCARQLKRVALVEVGEQQSCFGVHLDVPKTVEQVVAGAVRPPQLVPLSPDESSRPSPVGSVAAPLRVGCPEEECVRTSDQIKIFRQKELTQANSTGLGWVVALQGPDPPLNVLRTIAVGLLDRNSQAFWSTFDQGSIHPNAAP